MNFIRNFEKFKPNSTEKNFQKVMKNFFQTQGQNFNSLREQKIKSRQKKISNHSQEIHKNFFAYTQQDKIKIFLKKFIP